MKNIFFVITFLFGQSILSIGYAFDAGEHALIGDIAYSELAPPFPNSFSNLENNMDYTYGDLVAMSGDMYESLEELSLNDPKIFNSLHKRNRNSLKSCVDKEIQSIKNDTTYTGCDDLRFASKKLKYVLLAHDNFTHFSWHNVVEYIKHHQKALWFASLANLQCGQNQLKKLPNQCENNRARMKKLLDESEYRHRLKSKYRKFPKLFPRKSFSQDYLYNLSKSKLIQLSMFSNAFADHFLTDMFSAGHLRVPRSQIDSFVETYQQGSLVMEFGRRTEGSTLSGALSQLLHNLDGYETGTSVVNSLGQSFFVRSDKQLFSNLGSSVLNNKFQQNKQLAMPVNAVKVSIKEVLDVILNGPSEIPTAEFASLYYVPFVHKNVTKPLHVVLQDAIDDSGKVKHLIKKMSAEMSLLFKGMLLIDDEDYKDYMKDFVDSLPLMMTSLRDYVAKESQNEEISKRIPSALLKGLQEIH